MSNIPSEKVVAKPGQENYAKHLMLFIGKFIYNFGSKILLSYFEMNYKGATEYFLNRDFESIYELDSVIKKKVVLYGICTLMSENYSTFQFDFMKFLTTNMIALLEKFYKSNLNYGNDNVLTIIDNCNFQSNSINKLQNTDIKVILV